jgi:hypothetical protein
MIKTETGHLILYLYQLFFQRTLRNNEPIFSQQKQPLILPLAQLFSSEEGRPIAHLQIAYQLTEK